MRWVAKESNPPIYVWWDDEWYNETDGLIYIPSKEKMAWINQKAIYPFTKKTKIVSKE